MRNTITICTSARQHIPRKMWPSTGKNLFFCEFDGTHRGRHIVSAVIEDNPRVSL